MEFKMHTHQDSADTIWKGSWRQLLEALSLKKKNTRTQTNMRTVQILSRRKAGGNFLSTVLKNDVFSVARGTKLVYL